jgi:hypothetical protein
MRQNQNRVSTWTLKGVFARLARLMLSGVISPPRRFNTMAVRSSMCEGRRVWSSLSRPFGPGTGSSWFGSPPGIRAMLLAYPPPPRYFLRRPERCELGGWWPVGPGMIVAPSR